MMRIIIWIKRKLNRCDRCWKEATSHFSLPPMSEEDTEHFYQYCYDHAVKSGFCLGCGGFFAGVESFDFSSHRGWCDDCHDEIESELGIGEEYGDMDYYDDYAHDFNEKQPLEVKN